MRRSPVTLPPRRQLSRRMKPRRLAGLLLALFACLVVAGCMRQDSKADDNRSGGFYGGVSGGVTRP